ncbi:MAG: hypothetical protein HQL47_03495 [Gammaproteobacteria bacterium]|nr:hypothetical protein [Gammaproteobacteria bacterium]
MASMLTPGLIQSLALVGLLFGAINAVPAASSKTIPIVQGYWVEKKAGCQAAPGLFFDYRDSSLSFKDFSCEIKQVRHYGGIRYLVDMACKAKGLEFDDTIALDVSRDKSVFLHYPNIGSNSDEFMLCKKAPKTTKASVASGAVVLPAKTKARLEFSSVYLGKVGKSSVESKLNFYKDGSVDGEYVTQMLGNVYQLQGANPRDGVLQLKEFTNGRHTANVELTKAEEDGRLAWKGKMHNLDGRVVEVIFVKKP